MRSHPPRLARLACLSFAGLACVAEAAEPDARMEAQPLLASVGDRGVEDRGVEPELPAGAVAMTELSVAPRPLEPAREQVPEFLPGWQLPAHAPGTLPRWLRHETVPRETIEQLALRYAVDPRALRSWNDMAADGQPHPRRPKPLRVYAHAYPPPRQPLEHVVVAGEGWGSIARRYGVDSSKLRAWNVGETGRELEPGERVQVWADPIILDAIVHDQPRDARAALVRPGAHGVGTPQDGVLVAGVQIPPGDGYSLRYPNSAWGTTYAVREAVAALDRYAASPGARPITVGTMSRQRGGPIGGHNSHQTGRDLDIRLPLRAEVPQGLDPTPRRVDWVATWALVDAFTQADSVEAVFLDYGGQRRLYKAADALGVDPATLEATLQYPRGSAANLGRVRHVPGHEGHIHVRFRCGPAEPECG